MTGSILSSAEIIHHRCYVGQWLSVRKGKESTRTEIVPARVEIERAPAKIQLVVRCMAMDVRAIGRASRKPGNSNTERIRRRRREKRRQRGSESIYAPHSPPEAICACLTRPDSLILVRTHSRRLHLGRTPAILDTTLRCIFDPISGSPCPGKTLSGILACQSGRQGPTATAGLGPQLKHQVDRDNPGNFRLKSRIHPK